MLEIFWDVDIVVTMRTNNLIFESDLEYIVTENFGVSLVFASLHKLFRFEFDLNRQPFFNNKQCSYAKKPSFRNATVSSC